MKSRDRVAILAAMSIASELLELQERLHETGSDADAYAEGILARLDRALAMD